MEKMSTTAASGWFFLGWIWFLAWLAFALWSPWTSKITPPLSAKDFFTKAQYDILYPAKGKAPFDVHNPNPGLSISPPPANPPKNPTPDQKKEFAQVPLLTKWGFNGCVITDGMASQSKFDSACFCENSPAVRAIFNGGWAVQPWNTLSTFPLSIAGLIILGFLVFSDPPPQANYMTSGYLFGLCYAAMTIILGPLSMALHLGLQDVGGWFDSISLFIWFGFVACYGVFRFFVSGLGNDKYDEIPAWAFVLFFVGWAICIVVPATTSRWAGVNAEIWYGILGAVALAGEGGLWIAWAATRDSRPARWPTRWKPTGAKHWYSNLLWETGGTTWFYAGAGTFVVALTIWFLSWTRMPLCAPDIWFQGHAVFHTLSAFALVFLYKYYRHEGETP